MIQTHWVIEQLHRQWSNLEITIEKIRTTGDRITDVPLSQIGGDGVFVTEIERALSEHRIDLAVHSLKDLPTVQPDGMHIVVVGPREDVRDVFVTKHEVSISQEGFSVGVANAGKRSFRIGTCSLRRMAQIRRIFPDAEILPLRGNVDTRLGKLEANEYDGIILAAAGLHRLGLQERLANQLNYFPVEMMMPAPGQGALALEIRDEPEMRALLAPLRDVGVQATTYAERTFMRRLGAGCYLPVAAYGEVTDETLTLLGLVTSLDAQQHICIRQSMHWTPRTNIEHAEQLGVSLAEEALTLGAYEIIHAMNLSKDQERQHA